MTDLALENLNVGVDFLCMEIECLRTRATEIVEWELSFKWRLVHAPDEPREKSQGSLSKAFLKGERKKESSNPLSPKRLIVKVNTQVCNLLEREKYFKTKQSTSTPFWIIRALLTICQGNEKNECSIYSNKMYVILKKSPSAQENFTSKRQSTF